MDIKKHEDALKYFVNTLRAELEEYSHILTVEAYNNAYKLIIEAKSRGNRVHVTGIGKPSYVAGYIASLLSSTGTSAYVLHGTEAIHGSSGQVQKGDVVIAISNSGETEELKKTVTTLKNNNAKIIAVAGNENSWLARNSDAFLFAGVGEEGGPLNKAPRASYLAEIIVLQGLSVLLQSEENIDLQDYKRWHPGGTLGASIKGGYEYEG